MDELFSFARPRALHDVLLSVEHLSTTTGRLAHLASHPSPTDLEARIVHRGAIESAASLHQVICRPSMRVRQAGDDR